MLKYSKILFFLILLAQILSHHLINGQIQTKGGTRYKRQIFKSLSVQTVSSLEGNERNPDDDNRLTEIYPTHTVDIIKSHGYPVETHLLETEDGYLLELHRIPPIIKESFTNKLPVLVTHGNFQSSAMWVTNTPSNNSFAFVLHSMGYDVWLGNNRGNPYGQKHRWLNPSSSAFWNFTFHEMGIYDMPSTIDYILAETGASKLHYASTSMGPTALLAGLSHKPEYNDKIASAVLMGPAVFMANFYNGATYFLSPLAKYLRNYLNLFGNMPVIPPSLGRYMHRVLPRLCDPKRDVVGICQSMIQILLGSKDGGLMTKDQFAKMLATTPASGSSLKLVNHALQLCGSKGFHEYDYGRSKNFQIYHQAHPPSYNLTKATIPIALFVGNWDILGHREDAKTLGRKLPNLIEYYVAPYKEFCHLDFIYGREVAAQLYFRAIDIFKKYE